MSDRPLQAWQKAWRAFLASLPTAGLDFACLPHRYFEASPAAFYSQLLSLNPPASHLIGNVTPAKGPP